MFCIYLLPFCIYLFLSVYTHFYFVHILIVYDIQKWQIEYELYTEHQQLYFFSFIVAIVVMIQYIDIEFSNQPVVIPSCTSSSIIADAIEELIQPNDVIREKEMAFIFKGSAIPPSTIWKAASNKDIVIQPRSTNILHKFDVRLSQHRRLTSDKAINNEEKDASSPRIRRYEDTRTVEIYLQDRKLSIYIYICQ